MLNGKRNAKGHLVFVVSNWDQALDLIDGVPWTLDGVHGFLKVDTTMRFDTRVLHEASASGKRSEAYQAQRELCRDDYVTDLTEGERLVGIMHELGIRFESEKAS